MHIIIRATTLSIFFLGIAAALAIAGTHQVLRVIDGDTIIIEDGRRIQLLGVDAPEINDRLGWNKQQADRVRIDVSKVDAAALKSKEFVEKLIDGNAIEVDLDGANFNTQSKDAYNRTLAYVYVKAGETPVMKLLKKLGIGESELVYNKDSSQIFLNATLIKNGYGFAYSRYPASLLNYFQTLENDAKENRRGIWN